MTSPVMTPTRRQIARLLWARPGLSRRSVAREVDLDDSTAAYHLDRLVREGVIIQERVGRVVAHYPVGWGDARARKYAALSADARVVLAALQEEYGAMRAVDLARRLDVRVSVIRAALHLAVRSNLARRVGRGKYEVVA
ncbi:MAG: winged helix-turn-helix transcriptional regulator [Candidatus Thermoplasmatota archaeon]